MLFVVLVRRNFTLVRKYVGISKLVRLYESVDVEMINQLLSSLLAKLYYLNFFSKSLFPRSFSSIFVIKYDLN